MERYGMPRSEVAFSNLMFSYLAMKVVFFMDKEHLREGRDSQSGYQEISYVAACNLLLKRKEPCNTWVLTITGRSGEISRINNGMTFPACCLGQITCVCNKCLDHRLGNKTILFSWYVRLYSRRDLSIGQTAGITLKFDLISRRAGDIYFTWNK
jgi:hypothetical protein